MKLLSAFVAALWLFVVSVQALSHLSRYGLAPILPDWVGRLDFTPQYTVLLGLVIVAAVARCLASRTGLER
jgi:ABC-type transporter Mla maintaining outer membrane lipid asymmetry permease subunit MlaE